MTGEKILNYKIEGIKEENEVYRSFVATHTQFAKKVMIKTLKASFEEGEREHFVGEIKKISQIQHPNIVTLYDYLPTPSNFYLVFEEVQGKSLLDYVHKISGPIPEEKAKNMFAQILDGFEYIHQNQLEGLGLSPANINVVDGAGKIKILDTALSTIFREKNIETEDFNYLSFASPEQASGQQTDKRSDIYSLGLILFYCLTGKNPYAQNTLLETKQLIQQEELPDPREFYPAISEDIIAVVRKATAKNPVDRFKSCNEFKEAIFTPQNQETTDTVYTDSPEGIIEVEKAETRGRFVNVPLILLGVFAIIATWMIYRYNNPTKPTEKQLIITDQSYIGNKRDSVLKAQAQKDYEDSLRIFVESKNQDTTEVYVHKVQPRENLAKIAERYFVTLDTLKYMNDGITEKTKLKVLSGIKVPIWKIHKMKKEETIYNIANQYRLSAFILRVANGVQSEEEDLFEGRNLVIPFYMKKK